MSEAAATTAPERNSLGFAKPPTETRVAVAMSGGVDSSTVAALLKAEGYDVVGLTLQLYDHGVATGKKGACCAGQDIHDARRVAACLDMPHYVLNYERRFREAVIDDFVDTYLAGATPIPCVRCNERVKFRDLLDTARDLGADALATGHYVRRIEGAFGPELHCARDVARDQSYFLFTTTRVQLDFLRFPLGSLTKPETRSLAARFGLSTAGKPDSQDICFVPEGRYTGLINKLRPGATEPGEIVHLDGRVLGCHEGIIHYTVGQRRGLGVSGGEPLFVVRLDAERRRVVVGSRAALLTATIEISALNWLGDAPLGPAPQPVLAKVRSTRSPVPARIVAADGGARVLLDEAEEGVAPGQACVFYDPTAGGSRVLGGGWIVRGHAAHEPTSALTLA